MPIRGPCRRCRTGIAASILCRAGGLGFGALVALAGGALADTGQTKALLIGVSEYPSLPVAMQLHGPRNDVADLRSLLLERGVPAVAIRVLADGVAGAALPTRDNILGELERLVVDARRGDQVLLYFAGHGSQQPVDPQSPYADEEPDGLFETFLPRDVGTWEQAPGRPGGTVRNAIVDHEIRTRVDKIGANGAFVWAIFDACHAASLVRGGADDAEAEAETGLRRVPPEALGVPALVSRRVASAAGSPLVARAAPDRAAAEAVYFYAAQSHESTAEMRLPPRQPDSVVHGVFTYALLQSLAGGAGMSYRQLGQSVLMRYAALGVRAGITPLFAGTALDSPVFGVRTAAVRQWRLLVDDGALAVAAGELSDLHPGAILAVLPTPTSARDAAIGHVGVARASAHRSSLVPVAHAGLREQAVATLAAGAVARLVLPATRVGLRLSADLSACTTPCRFDAALNLLRGDAPVFDAGQLAWAAVGEAVDLRLVAVGERLWLLPGSATGRPCNVGSAAQRAACADTLARSTASITALASAEPRSVGAALKGALRAAARAIELFRVASQAATEPAGALQVEVSFVRAGAAETPYREGTIPELVDGDHVKVVLRNTGPVGADVTALYLDSRYGIDVMVPRPGALNRLEPGASTRFEIALTTAVTQGLERLIVVVEPARSQQERADFSALRQSALPGNELVRGGQGGEAVRASIRVASWHLRR